MLRSLSHVWAKRTGFRPHSIEYRNEVWISRTVLSVAADVDIKVGRELLKARFCLLLLVNVINLLTEMIVHVRTHIGSSCRCNGSLTEMPKDDRAHCRSTHAI